MAYARPFVVNTYEPSGEFLSETEHVSSFEADVTAQRLSVEGEGRVALVKDRRHTVTKLIRVWAGGRTIFSTPHMKTAGATQAAFMRGTSLRIK